MQGARDFELVVAGTLVLPGDRLVFAEVKLAEAAWHEGRACPVVPGACSGCGLAVILLTRISTQEVRRKVQRSS